MCKQFYHANYFCRSNLLQSSSTSWQHLSSNASSDTAQEAEVHIPLILEIQRTRKVYIYEPREDVDIEVIYLPDFETRNEKKRD